MRKKIIFYIMFATTLIFLIVGANIYVRSNLKRVYEQTTQTSPHGNGKVTVSYPQKNSEIKSPLNMNGSVPQGWMFEGAFPIKILGSNRQVIAHGIATEVIPGSWMTAKEIEFITDIEFSTNEKSGFIILQKDNPSDLPENAETYEFPVKFNFDLPYQCPNNGWVNCMPILNEEGKKACSGEAMEWYKKNCPNFQGSAL